MSSQRSANSTQSTENRPYRAQNSHIIPRKFPENSALFSQILAHKPQRISTLQNHPPRKNEKFFAHSYSFFKSVREKDNGKRNRRSLGFASHLLPLEYHDAGLVAIGEVHGHGQRFQIV